MTRTLKFATWNIAGGRIAKSDELFHYEDKENADYFITKLRELDADIVCLQESHYSADNSLSRRIAAAIGMPYVFETPNHPSHIEQGFDISTAILSKLPFVSTQSIQLPYPEFEMRFKSGKLANTYHKFLQIVTLDGFTLANIHTQPLRVFSYDYHTGDGKTYAHQIEDMLLTELEAPLVLAGDFNIEHVNTLFTRLFDKLKLRDSLNPKKATDIHGRHIDYILCSMGFEVIKSGIEDSQSDHQLCWAILSRP